MSAGGDNTRKAITPSWDSQDTPGSSFVQLLPPTPDTRQMLRWGDPQGSHSLHRVGNSTH